MLNIYIQAIHISTVPLHGRDIFIYHLGLDKRLKKLEKNNPTQPKPAASYWSLQLLCFSRWQSFSWELEKRSLDCRWWSLLPCGKLYDLWCNTYFPGRKIGTTFVLEIVWKSVFFLPKVASAVFCFGDDVLHYASVKVVERHHHPRWISPLWKKKCRIPLSLVLFPVVF